MGRKLFYTKDTYHDYLMSLLPNSNFTLDIYNGTEYPCEITCKNCNTHYSFSKAALLARRVRRGNTNVCKKCEENNWTKVQELAKNKALYLLEKKKTIILKEGLISWGSKINATWLCTKCNHTFEKSPFVMFNQNGLFCPWCETRPFEYSLDMIKEKAQELWGDEYSLLSIDSLKNKNGSKRIIVAHNKCGFKYSVNLYNFLHGQGCPHCKVSHGERKVRNYLNKYNFKFQEQMSIQIKNTYLKLDFYLEENNQKYAIEYNGIQHYQPIEYFGGQQGYEAQIMRDKLKKEYCSIHNINLIIIPYNDESLLDKDILAQRLHGQAT